MYGYIVQVSEKAAVLVPIPAGKAREKLLNNYIERGYTAVAQLGIRHCAAVVISPA